jgi:sortase A
MISYVLIGLGLVLVGWGSWIFYQNYLEASKPPPAPIIEVSLEDLETPTVQASFTPVVPTEVSPTETQEPPVEDTATVVPDERTFSATPEVNTPTPSPEPTTTPTAEATPTPEPSSHQELASVTEAKILEEFALSQALEQTPEPTDEAVLTLEDNPLLVEQATPLPEAAAAEQQPVAEPVPEAPAGSLTRIVAENIALDAPVIDVGWKQVVQNGVPVNVWTVADYAAGWHTNSMLPGQGGNIVLSGHHNIKGEVFRYIVDLEPGAVISLYLGDQRYDYAVDDKFIVKDKGEPQEVRIANARWIGPFNEERLTMVTCWPYNNNTHRVIVIAKPL